MARALVGFQRSITGPGWKRRPRILAFALALTGIALATGPARANPIMGTITATVGDSPGGGPIPTRFLSAWSVDAQGRPGVIDLSTLPRDMPLPGGDLGYNRNGRFSQTINAPIDLRITFNGADGSHPYIELTGTLNGLIGGTDTVANMGGYFSPTLTSGHLYDWTPASGIPTPLVNAYMNLAAYHLDGAIEGGAMNGVGYLMTVQVPEPTSIVVHAAALGCLAFWRRRVSRTPSRATRRS